MKKHLQKYIILAVSIYVASCSMDLPTQLEFESYEFASIDENGGELNPILISKGSEITVSEPNDITSAEYLEELSEVKIRIANKSDQEKRNTRQWTNNPVVRWNEIALELIAKYNLIPGPNPDGTYTLPTPSNPQGPPSFPFAHPPYASRVLAYLSVSQYDGLIVAWHYKFF